MRYFPTEQWLEEYGRLLEESGTLDGVATGWGVGFDGDVLFVIEDLPLAETTLGDLPEPVLADLPEGIQASIEDVTLAEAPTYFDEGVRESLPGPAAMLLDQLEASVVDGDVYAYIGLVEGHCTGVELLESPDEREVGFVIRGDYTVWRQIIDGRPAASALLSNDLTIEGSWFRLGQYAAVPQLLGDIAAEVETVHLFQGAETSTSDALLDEAVRTPVAVQRLAQRQATLVSRTFGFL
ncbi:sterol carrier protein [Halorarius litoreus]|uniref:sterol carrier protein n=1 Tax=Halorarius litoreus TaxID=2962676 RepID=UPI0020CF0F77|nr:sterol carrier protein [Halorarius litoreus]